MRFVTELCKMRAFTELWDEITLRRYGVADPAKRRFRYGVQVNSLGLTEQQPENNAYRILIEMLSVVLSKKRARPRGATCRPGTRRSACRARSISNGRCGCSRSWPIETDLLEYGDLFDGIAAIEAKVAALKARGAGRTRRDRRDGRRDHGDRTGYMKRKLVEIATRARLEASSAANRSSSASTASRRASLRR